MFYVIELVTPQMWYTDRGWSALPNHVVRFGSDAAATDRAKHESIHAHPPLPLVVKQHDDDDAAELTGGKVVATVKLGRLIPST